MTMPLGVTRVISSDVPGEAAVAMVVLPVDVRGDGASDGDVAGAGCHRHEPAGRNEVPHQVVQADAPTDLDRARPPRPARRCGRGPSCRW